MTAAHLRAKAPSMTIAHLALWTSDLERLRSFYEDNFGCTAGPRYTNPTTGFSSYFLRFASGASLELMSRPELAPAPPSPHLGYAHLALSLGGEDQVRLCTEQFAARGIPVLSPPRRTGDGYFESVVADPDGNLIELTA